MRGRYFTAQDTAQSAPAALISQTVARRFWPNQDPLGRHVVVETVAPGRSAHGAPVSRQIVGIVGDIKRFGLSDKNATEIYVPALQNPAPFSFVAVRVHPCRQSHARGSDGGVAAQVIERFRTKSARTAAVTPRPGVCGGFSLICPGN